MSDMQADHGTAATPGSSGDVPAPAGLDGIVADVRADIAAGRVDDDVSAELRRRADEAGVAVSDEDLESVASDLEIEASR